MFYFSGKKQQCPSIWQAWLSCFFFFEQATQATVKNTKFLCRIMLVPFLEAWFVWHWIILSYGYWASSVILFQHCWTLRERIYISQGESSKFPYKLMFCLSYSSVHINSTRWHRRRMTDVHSKRIVIYKLLICSTEYFDLKLVSLNSCE